MLRKGTYYLLRINKSSHITNNDLIGAIKKSAEIVRANKTWTLINVKEYKNEQGHFIYGHLNKYEPEAIVKTVDREKRIEKPQPEPNLIIASSPFIYIPAYAGVVFLQVHNQIEVKTFIRYFAEIIKKSFDYFFVDNFEVKPITDLRTFATKLSTLEGIYKLQARISPPNPLFGHLWASLKEYLKRRKAEKMTISEESSNEQPLKTDIIVHIDGIINQNNYQPEKVEIGDASILMATDGYGNGTVKGKRNNEFVVIKTSETIRNFKFDKSPDPEELYKKAVQIYKKINEERHMKH
jgi:hypothetical protein